MMNFFNPDFHPFSVSDEQKVQQRILNFGTTQWKFSICKNCYLSWIIYFNKKKIWRRLLSRKHEVEFNQQQVKEEDKTHKIS